MSPYGELVEQPVPLGAHEKPCMSTNTKSDQVLAVVDKPKIDGED